MKVKSTLAVATAAFLSLATFGFWVLNKVETIQNTSGYPPLPNALKNPSVTLPDLSSYQKVDGGNKKVHNLKLEGERVVFISGEITESAYVHADKIKELSAVSKEPIFVLLNSPGGSVLDGALIISAIAASPAPVYTVCMQLCASMAAMIHQYGKERLMADRSILMFHDAAGSVSGYFPHMISRLNTLTRYVNKMNYHVARRANVPLNDYLAKIHEELWLDAEDAIHQGYADKIVNVLVNAKETIVVPQTPNKYKSKINIQW